MAQADRRGPLTGPTALLRIGTDPHGDVARALELSGGLAGLKPGDRVLIKPNLVGIPSTYHASPYGVLTTTLILEGLIKALKDAGVGHLTVAEGGITYDDMGISTRYTIDYVGLPALARRYGLTVLDLTEHPYAPRTVGDLTLKVSEQAFAHDFVISLPVLKTHTQCKVSLSLKNLKGLLQLRSKVACHGPGESLNRHVADLADLLYPDLALIDGRYSLSRGPTHSGQAKRSDLLIASPDPLDADLVGSAVLGYDPVQVEHLRLVAAKRGRGLDLPELAGGLAIADCLLNLPYDWEWADEYTPAAFQKHKVTGVLLPKYDFSLCTGCSVIYNPLMIMLMAASRTMGDLGGVEVLTGKEHKPSGRAKRTVLLGNCMIKHCRKHPDAKDPVLVSGCPPTLGDIARGLQKAGIPAELAAYRWFADNYGKNYTPENGFLPSDFQPGE
jgi:uncharacterized protein (DUF362 family)